MKSIKLKANAKINLSLLITGVMEDGFHELDTVMCPIDLYDIVTVTKREDNIINIQGLDIPDEENSAVIAAKLLMNEFNTQGVDIIIKKNIPLSGGLGGSSADAAAILYAFSKLYYIDINKIKFFARQIGSDIPFLMQVNSGAMRARGRGDILTAEDIDSLNVVIAKPERGVDTKEAYKLYDNFKNNKKIGDNSALINAIRNKEDICEYLINDLYKPAVLINSDVEILYKLMCKLNNSCVNMSGSGSSIVAICSTIEDAENIYNKIPNIYYKKITKTIKKGIEEI